MIGEELHQDGEREAKTLAPGYGEFFAQPRPRFATGLRLRSPQESGANHSAVANVRGLLRGV
jgi:hypothetical protein